MELAATRTRVERDRAVVARDAVVALAAAVGVFALSYAGGGYQPTTRAYAGIAVWWLLGVGAAIGLASARSRIGRLPLVAAGLLAAYALWTLISLAWAPDAERAFAQFNQVSLYVAVFAVAIVLARLVPAFVFVGGVALGLSGVTVVSLVSRLFPSSFGAPPGAESLSSLFSRLSFPLGYWNGVGTEAALALPLLLALMTSRRSRVLSALAALPLPVLAADMYLTSSRGSFLAAGIATVAYLALTPKRWPAAGAVLVAVGSAVVAIATIRPRREFVEGRSTALSVSQGHHVALVVGIVAVCAALVWLGATELGRRVPNPPARVGWALTALLVLAAVAAIVASHPVGKFESFKSSSYHLGGTTSTPSEQHLLSTSGGGRWQFWSVASTEFQAHPLEGGGAGSWVYWWLQRGSLPAFSAYPHSLYLQALSELGIVGLLLLAGAVVVGVVGAVRSALTVRSVHVAAAAACGIAFFAAVSWDWIWQLAGLTVAGVAMLGVALGALPSTRASAVPGRLGGAVRPLLALVAVAAIVPQVVLLAATLHLRNSHNAALVGDTARSRSEALAAKAVEPWAAAPYTQLALIEDAQGHYATARSWAGRAIARSPLDASLWALAATIDTERGKVFAARRELAEARRLDPHNAEYQSAG